MAAPSVGSDVGTAAAWRASQRSCAMWSELLSSSSTSRGLVHLRLPPRTHAASFGALQLSFGMTAPPCLRMAATIANSSSGKRGTGTLLSPSSSDQRSSSDQPPSSGASEPLGRSVQPSSAGTKQPSASR